MVVLVGGYAMLQHYGHDFSELKQPVHVLPVSSTNAILDCAVLRITIPITLILAAVTFRQSAGNIAFGGKVGRWR